MKTKVSKEIYLQYGRLTNTLCNNEGGECHDLELVWYVCAAYATHWSSTAD